MNLKTIAAGILAAAAYAQTGNPPAPAFTEVKAYLNLTDAQITGIQAVQGQLRTAIGNLEQQARTKQTDLQTRLNAGTSDAAAVGRLLLEIAALRKQIETQASTFREQAKNLLTADQKTKLKALEDAAKLEAAIRQAAHLLLLAPPTPAVGGPGGFGGPGGPGPRMGPGMGPGPQFRRGERPVL